MTSSWKVAAFSCTSRTRERLRLTSRRCVHVGVAGAAGVCLRVRGHAPRCAARAEALELEHPAAQRVAGEGRKSLFG